MNVNGTEGSHEVGEGDERPSVMNEIDVCCAECGEEEARVSVSRHASPVCF